MHDSIINVICFCPPFYHLSQKLIYEDIWKIIFSDILIQNKQIEANKDNFLWLSNTDSLLINVKFQVHEQLKINNNQYEH